jgi:hypothetical protein
MQIVDASPHPGPHLVRPTIPSVTGGPPPSGATPGRPAS